MWRSLFLAIGLFMIFLGIAFLGVERVELRMRENRRLHLVSLSRKARQEIGRVVAVEFPLRQAVISFTFTFPDAWPGEAFLWETACVQALPVT